MHLQRVSQVAPRAMLQSFPEHFPVAEAITAVELVNVDEMRLVRAVDALCSRHEMLHTVFERAGNEENAAEFSSRLVEASWALERGVVRVWGASNLTDALYRCRGANSLTWPSSLLNDTLWRMFLVYDESNELRWLIFMISHAIGDGTSFAVCFADLFSFYHGLPVDRPIFQNTHRLFESLRSYALSPSFPNIDALKASVLGSAPAFCLPTRPKKDAAMFAGRDLGNVAKMGISIKGLTVPFGPWYVKCFTQALANVAGRPDGFISCVTHARNIPKHIIPHLHPEDAAHIDDLKNNFGFFAFGFMQKVDARWSLDEFRQNLKEGVETAYDQMLASSFLGATFKPSDSPHVVFNMIPGGSASGMDPFRKVSFASDDAHRYTGGQELRMWFKVFVVHAELILVHFDRRVFDDEVVMAFLKSFRAILMSSSSKM